MTPVSLSLLRLQVMVPVSLSLCGAMFTSHRHGPGQQLHRHVPAQQLRRRVCTLPSWFRLSPSTLFSMLQVLFYGRSTAGGVLIYINVRHH